MFSILLFSRYRYAGTSRVSYLDLRWAIHQMGRLNLVGADMVELAPMLDASWRIDNHCL